MSRGIILILIIFNMGCMGSLESKNLEVIDEEFKLFHQRFLDIAESLEIEIPIYPLSINFDESLKYRGPFTVNGICSYRTRDIGINPEQWVDLSLEEKELLIFHELGHCLLNRDHKKGRETDPLNNRIYPASLMNAFLFSRKPYTDIYDYFIQELFTPETTLASLKERGNTFDYSYYGHEESSPLAPLSKLSTHSIGSLNCGNNH